MNIVESIKAKLKNRAIKNNRSYHEVITIYGLERMQSLKNMQAPRFLLMDI